MTAQEGPVEVPIAGIDAELSRQLKAAQDGGQSPVHRARMSNLIIHCDSEERAVEVEKSLPRIVAVHPARVLLLIADPADRAPEVRASVVVRKAGQSAQLNSEQITLRGGSCASEQLPFAVRSLMIGDLPTNLWWANNTPPALAGPILGDLAEDAQQLIYDSLGWLDPNRGVAATYDWLGRFDRPGKDGRWRVASDLNWRRLKTWRRLFSEAFGPPDGPDALNSITEINMEHGPHAVTQAWSLAGWLASRLGWEIRSAKIRPNVEIALDVRASQGLIRLRFDRAAEGPAELRRVRVSCTLAGKKEVVAFFSEEGTRLAVHPENDEGSPRTITVQGTDVADMLARQLSDREPDPAFRDAMANAQHLARTLPR